MNVLSEKKKKFLYLRCPPSTSETHRMDCPGSILLYSQHDSRVLNSFVSENPNTGHERVLTLTHIGI